MSVNGVNPFKDFDFEGYDMGGIKPDELSANGAGGSAESKGIDKTGAEGASSQMGNSNAKIDMSQFTNENDIQEIDLQEFEDDM